MLSQRYHCFEYTDIAIARVETTVFIQRTIPVFVASSASTTYRTVVVTTQLSLSTLEFVSNILKRKTCRHEIVQDLLLVIWKSFTKACA